MTYDDDNILSISGIQHFVFCRRQWALIHIEQQWAENLLTVSGEIMHNKAHDNTFSETRNGVIVSRGMQVASYELGIFGECELLNLFRLKAVHCFMISLENILSFPLNTSMVNQRYQMQIYYRLPHKLCALKICFVQV